MTKTKEIKKMVQLYQTFNFQLDKEALSEDAKAFGIEGKLCGSIIIPLYSSSHPSSNSKLLIKKLGGGTDEPIFGDKTFTIVPNSFFCTNNGTTKELFSTHGNIEEECFFHDKPEPKYIFMYIDNFFKEKHKN